MTNYAQALKREADTLRERALSTADPKERILTLHRANVLIRKASQAEDIAKENKAALAGKGVLR